MTTTLINDLEILEDALTDLSHLMALDTVVQTDGHTAASDIAYQALGFENAQEVSMEGVLDSIKGFFAKVMDSVDEYFADRKRAKEILEMVKRAEKKMAEEDEYFAAGPTRRGIDLAGELAPVFFDDYVTPYAASVARIGEARDNDDWKKIGKALDRSTYNLCGATATPRDFRLTANGQYAIFFDVVPGNFLIAGGLMENPDRKKDADWRQRATAKEMRDLVMAVEKFYKGLSDRNKVMETLSKDAKKVMTRIEKENLNTDSINVLKAVVRFIKTYASTCESIMDVVDVEKSAKEYLESKAK